MSPTDFQGLCGESCGVVYFVLCFRAQHFAHTFCHFHIHFAPPTPYTQLATVKEIFCRDVRTLDVQRFRALRAENLCRWLGTKTERAYI